MVTTRRGPPSHDLRGHAHVTRQRRRRDLSCDADQAIDWAFAYDWTKEETRLLPQDAFAIGRAHPPGTFCVLDEPFSSGFAAHRSLTLALQRALYELIERDALLLAWFLQLPLTELQWSSDEQLTLEMNAYLTAHDIELRHYDLRVDFDLPCMLTVARTARDYGPWRAGGVIVTANAGPSWERVRAHALQELIGHFSAYGVVAPDGDKHLDPGSGEERRWWPAFAQYLSPREDRPFAFLDTRSKAPFPADPPAPDLRREFQQRGLSVFVRPLGARDVQRSGLQVARAYVPELLRLTPTRAEIDFDAPRIAAMREKWRARSPFNPLPHPIT